MIIDIAVHLIPPRLLERVRRLTGRAALAVADTVPGLCDLDEQRRTVERFADHGYRQILSLATQVTEDAACRPHQSGICSAANEELRELVERDPVCFAGALGALPMDDPGAALREVDHLVELGLPGFQVHSSVFGRPLDDPAILEVLEYAFSRGLVCFLHPLRGPAPDYPSEERSRYGLSQLLGQPYEISLALLRLALSGLFDRHPQGVLIAHHLGGMIPFFASRIEAHYRRGEPDLRVALPRDPIEYLRDCYGDTALDGGPHAIRCGVEFFGPEHVVFGSDYPFDGHAGVVSIQRTIEAIQEAALDEARRRAIYAGNARRVLGL